jgi:hypothetical protein
MKLNIFTQTKFTFEGQKEGEHMEIFLYRHWLTLVLKLIHLGIMVIFPIIPFFIFLGVISRYHLEAVVFFLLVMFYILLWSIAFFTITMYLLQYNIVTETRILDVDQYGFFSRRVAEMHLTKVQDITVKVNGLLPTIFAYGDIEIQTAGSNEKFLFEDVPHPNQTKDKIMELVKIAKAKKAAEKI